MTTDDVAAYVDATAAITGLNLRPEHRNEVIAAMRTLLQQAALVMEFPLAEDIEQLPVATP